MPRDFGLGGIGHLAHVIDNQRLGVVVKLVCAQSSEAAKEVVVAGRSLGIMLRVSIASCGMVLMAMLNGWAAEPVTAIGSLLINPSALHRKVFKLEGVAKNVVIHSGSEIGTKQSLCGAEFELEDGSGTIAVLYRARCQIGALRAAVVTERMSCVVEGHMEAPPTMVRTQDGKDLGVRIMAHTVTPVQ